MQGDVCRIKVSLDGQNNVKVRFHFDYKSKQLESSEAFSPPSHSRWLLLVLHFIHFYNREKSNFFFLICHAF